MMTGRATSILQLAVIVCFVSCAAQAASIVYPQIVVGGGYETVLTITNSGSSTLILHPIVKQRAGESFPVKANGILIGDYENWTIPRGATFPYVLTGDEVARPGYLILEPVEGPGEEQIATSIFFRSVSAGRVIDLVASYPAQAMKKAVFPVDRSAFADTGIALLPTDSPNILGPLRFTLLDQAGAKVQEVELGYSGHTPLMVAEIFEQIPTPFLGSVVIECPRDFYLLVLRLEVAGDSIQLTGVPPGRREPVLASPIRRLPFRVTDAEYSTVLDRIVAVSSDPHRLYLLEPVSGTEKHIDLSGAPYCVSVSPDGRYAAVGHKKSLSYVNLEQATVEKEIPVTAEPADVVLAGNGYAYIFPGVYVTGELHCVQISTGTETLTSETPPMVGSGGKVHPGGNSLYFVADRQYVGKYNITSGTASRLYWQHGSPSASLGDDLWISRDGTRIFMQTGAVLSSSDVREQDLKTISELGAGITHLSEAESGGILVLIPGRKQWSDDLHDDEIHVLDAKSL
ncbi:MAG: hypothetical protein EHM23_14450, partial [Acidobacteria bacterium]